MKAETDAYRKVYFDFNNILYLLQMYNYILKPTNKKTAFKKNIYKSLIPKLKRNGNKYGPLF